MNRRTSVKGILTLGILSITSLSIYKWKSFSKNVTSNDILVFKNLITEIADTIIPRTDSPGAKDAGVENYIITALIDCHNNIEQNKFVIGLSDLEEYTISIYNKTFKDCSEKQRIEILSYFEKKETYSIAVFNKINNKILGKPFFSLIKSLTVEGYCQSEIGATAGLTYDFIPSSFEPCISLTQNQKSWATK